MKLFTIIILALTLGYQAYKFIQLLVKMKSQPIFPLTDEDKQSIRKHPDKPLYSPTLSKQKTGVILHTFLLALLITVASVALAVSGVDDLNLTPFLPMIISFFYIHDTLNLFSVTEKGILSGSRFIPWKRMKHYSIEDIDINHKYYGYSKEANEGCVFKIKLTLFTIDCVVTSDEAKEKLETILQKHIPIQEDLVSNYNGIE